MLADFTRGHISLHRVEHGWLVELLC
jgi:hypothetical protein